MKHFYTLRHLISKDTQNLPSYSLDERIGASLQQFLCNLQAILRNCVMKWRRSTRIHRVDVGASVYLISMIISPQIQQNAA